MKSQFEELFNRIIKQQVEQVQPNNNQENPEQAPEQKQEAKPEQKKQEKTKIELCSMIRLKDLPQQMQTFIINIPKKSSVDENSYCVVIKNIQDPSFKLIVKMIYFNILNKYSGNPDKSAQFNIWKSDNINYDGSQYIVFVFYQTDAINGKVQSSFKSQVMNQLQTVATIIPKFIDYNN